MKTKTKILSTSGLLLALALLLGINLVSGLFVKNVRIDLTENQLYTLSKGTKNIVSSLEEPITLRLYFSEKLFTGLPNVLSYGTRVKDLLAEYAALSNGKLSFVVADPEPFSEIEDEAVEYGLQGVPVDSVGNQAYFGVVGINSNDKRESIAFLQPDKEASLEYDLTRLIYSLAHPKQKVVGLMSSLPIEGTMAANPFMGSNGGGQAWFILNQIKQSFDVSSIEMDVTEIPSAIDVLMLVHPKQLSERTLFAIDQFVLNGGRLIAFVDPFAEEDQPATDPTNPMAAMQATRSSDLTLLFNAWGVDLVDGKVALDKTNAQQVQVQANGRVMAMPYVAWLSLDKSQLSTTDFITRDLEKVSLATAGYFVKQLDKIDAVDIFPLISTSPQAMAVDAMEFQMGVNPDQLLRQYESGDQSLMLAVRLNGKVNSAFPNGLNVTASDDAKDKAIDKAKTENTKKDDAVKKPVLSESKSPINVILVADTDMLADKHWVQLQNFFGNRVAIPHSNNDVFVLNAIENLSGSNDLISLRSRSKSAREFTKVVELKVEAEKRFQDKERELQTKLEETEQKLAQLQQQSGNASASILTPEQEQEIEGFRAEQLQTRKALRNVQHELVKSIESLGTTLKVMNIALVPLLVVIFALLFSMVRKRRLARG